MLAQTSGVARRSQDSLINSPFLNSASPNERVACADDQITHFDQIALPNASIAYKLSTIADATFARLEIVQANASIRVHSRVGRTAHHVDVMVVTRLASTSGGDKQLAKFAINDQHRLHCSKVR